MDRLTLIQELVARKKYRTYLEIGVFRGDVFLNVKCRHKIAVDPKFRFGVEKKRMMMWKNISNIRAQYFETTSDLFFESQTELLRKRKIDVCLVDGMHEFRCSLNDVLNTLDYLNEDGVIIMHDCNPLSAGAAISYDDWQSNKNFSVAWNGDVWKTIVYLRTFRKDLHVFVANCDYGLGIITKRIPSDPGLHFNSEEEIASLCYTDLEKNRESFLNLKPEEYLLDFFAIR